MDCQRWSVWRDCYVNIQHGWQRSLAPIVKCRQPLLRRVRAAVGSPLAEPRGLCGTRITLSGAALRVMRSDPVVIPAVREHPT
jgi:hypothetical protein